MPETGELVIAHLPNRPGLYLGVQESWGLRTLARFSGNGESAADRLVEILVAGGFSHEKKEGEDDGVLREQAG